MNQKRFILCVALVLMLLLSACGGAPTPSATCRVAVATDLHYLAPSLTDLTTVAYSLPSTTL